MALAAASASFNCISPKSSAARRTTRRSQCCSSRMLAAASRSASRPNSAPITHVQRRGRLHRPLRAPRQVGDVERQASAATAAPPRARCPSGAPRSSQRLVAHIDALALDGAQIVEQGRALRCDRRRDSARPHRECPPDCRGRNRHCARDRSSSGAARRRRRWCKRDLRRRRRFVVERIDAVDQRLRDRKCGAPLRTRRRWSPRSAREISVMRSTNDGPQRLTMIVGQACVAIISRRSRCVAICASNFQRSSGK